MSKSKKLSPKTLQSPESFESKTGSGNILHKSASSKTHMVSNSLLEKQYLSLDIGILMETKPTSVEKLQGDQINEIKETYES
jgi:hypothetical protein